MRKGLLLSATLLALSASAETTLSLYKDGKVIYSGDIVPDSLVFNDENIASSIRYTTKPCTSEEFPSADEFMNTIRGSIINDVPESATDSNRAGRVESIKYYSNLTLKEKPADVFLPKDYDKNKRYPVMYVNHGIYCNEKTLQEEKYKVITMVNNLVASGEAKEMIVVFTSIYTNPASDRCLGYTIEQLSRFDDFREDLVNCLMPYINSHYSTYTDREHTAVSGFSMGAREAMYIGMTRPFYFGYIGCACPAAGVIPGEDVLLTHPGIMKKEELTFKDGEPKPYVFMITGGTLDGAVGMNPKKYHEALESNGVDHLWQEIQDGKHDETCIVPFYYNFIKNVFKNKSDMVSE